MEKNKEKVLENYKKICKSLNIDEKNVYRPYQTHTDIVKIIKEEEPGIYTKNFENVDGLITDRNEKVLSLSFADCTALYFYDPNKNVIANIHSGWKGTYKEIGRIAVKKLKEEYGCNPEDLICCIGPCIKECCFEVSEDVKEMFCKKFYNMKNIIKSSKNNLKYYIDTSTINKIILIEEGLKEENIIDSNICTKCNNNKLHSYRQEKDKSGRNASIICII